MKITTIGIGLAKEVFQIHYVDIHGKIVLCKQLRRREMAKYFGNLESCLIGMEACCSPHRWARKLVESIDAIGRRRPNAVSITLI